MTVLALVDDLLFRSKLETAAAHIGVELYAASDVSVWHQAASGVLWQLVIIDLNLAASDPLNGIREIRAHAPTLPIIGYCSHGQVDLQAQAKEAGCTSVLSRSALVQQLPQLLQAVQQ